MNNRLSHSATNKYMQCPKSYEFHYVKKLRSKYGKAALLFGSAIDKALDYLLRSRDETNTAFMNAWTNQDINGVSTYLPTCSNIVYADADFDKELLVEEDIKELQQFSKIVDVYSEVENLYKNKKIIGFDKLSEEQKVLLNYANWLCLKRKGLLMVEAIRTKFLPDVEKVYGTQVYVKLENGQGDSIIGYADAVIKHKNYDKPIVIDFKTSTREYAHDSVLYSPQLTLYVHDLSEKYEDTRLAGFVVLDKKIKKNKVKKCSKCGFDGTGKRFASCNNVVNDERCDSPWEEKNSPEANVTVIINEIPEQTEEIVLDNYMNINNSIKNGIFHRNLQSCRQGAMICEFIDKCYKNKEDGLITVGDRK